MDHYSFAVFPDEDLLDLRPFQYGWEQCAPLHSFGPYVRNHYLFHYVISGRGFLDSNSMDSTSQHYDLEAGQGFLICPGQINTYGADQFQPWKYVWLEFDGMRAAKYLDEAGLNLSQPIYRPTSMEGAAQVQDALLYMAEHPDASHLQLIAHLYFFLDALIQTSSTRQSPRATQLQDFYIHEAINYMEKHYQWELTVEEIANACQLNRTYFSKLFKAKRGCPPQEFLIRLRLSKAADLLRTTSVSIGDICASCGYPNQLYFSQAFKQHYGLPPREWRAKNKVDRNR